MIFRYMSPTISRRYSESYRQASQQTQMTWNCQLASLMFSSATVGTVVFALLGPEVHADHIWGTSKSTQFLCAWIAGHMFADVVLYMLVEPDILKEKTLILHHVIFSTAALVVTESNATVYIFLLRALSEISNIPMIISWLVEHIYGRKSQGCFISAVLHLVIFIACRIIIIPYVYLVLLPELWTASPQPAVYIQIVCVAYNTSFDALNLYWCFHHVKKLLAFPGAEDGMPINSTDLCSALLIRQ